MSENPYNSPQTNPIGTDVPDKNPKNWKQTLFTFDGRISRKSWWLSNLALMAFIWILAIPIIPFYIKFIVALTKMDPTSSAIPDLPEPTAFQIIYLIALVLISLAMYWPIFALNIKRFHDREKGGLWSLIIFIPYLGALWLLIECGFLRGTSGNNQFGPNPLDQS